MKVLVVEDERVTLARIQGFLSAWGHEPIAATDGAEAWARFEREPCLMVITDWLMPKMDGLELIRRIRNNSDDGQYVYTILLTARADKDDIVQGMEAGADDFITKPFDREELRVRVRAGERIVELEHALALRNQQLTAANKRMKDDLKAAAKIQRAFLPVHPAEVDNVRFAWDITPCAEVAGDTLNIHQLGPHHVGVWVADVCGHGVTAALLSVTLSRALARLSGPNAVLVNANGVPVPPAEVAARLNRRFPWHADRKEYFTFLYGLLDTQTRAFCYVSAGHPGPVRVPSRGDVDLMPTTPPAIGLLPESSFTQQTVRLEPHDRLYMYTDGIVEALHPNGEMFGTQRLTESLANDRTAPLQASVDNLLANVAAWSSGHEPTDDLSVLGLEIA